MKFPLFQKSVYIISTTALVLSAAVNRPFPQQLSYDNCIKPNNVSQTAMNNSVKALFDTYKSNYLTPAKNTPGGYYTDASGNGSGGKNACTISEAHGYGMIIFALMAGYDSEAQTIFDGYFKFYKDHPSKINATCMSWEVPSDEGTKASTSAADGDMDIAYALLLAHYQWGSTGEINYLNEAKKLINNGIKPGDMHTETNRTALGDWNQPEYDNGADIYATRSSDWMPGHMRAFAVATGDDFWNSCATNVYSLISDITQNYSPNTGLMSDFVTGKNPAPDNKAGGTGESNADDYSYNACRYPWRIALDFAHNSTSEAQAALSKLSRWLRTSSSGNTDKIYAGYRLDGSKLVNYTELVFTAPFTAGLIADAANQDFLNSCWAAIKNDKGDNEYALALNLLSALVISGNWWAPAPQSYTAPTAVTLSSNQIAEKMAEGILIGTLSTSDGEAPFSYSVTNGGADFIVRNDSLFSKRTFDAATDNSLSCKIKSTDNRGNSSSKSFSISVIKSSANMVQQLAWWIDIDTYGTTAVDTGSALLTDTSLAVEFTLGKSNDKTDEWVYGILSCDPFDNSFADAGYITITYRSTNSFAMVLPMSEVTDDAYHSSLLPVTDGEWKTVTLAVDAATFTQPEDWGKAVEFNPASINQFSIDTRFEEEAGLIEIQTLLIDGMELQTVGTTRAEISQKSRGAFETVAMTQNNLTVNALSAGEFTISLFNLQGRELYRAQIELSEGYNTVPLRSSLSRGAYVISLKGNGISTLKKALIQ